MSEKSKLWNTFRAYKRGTITEEQAAEAFGLTVKSFRFRQSALGDRFELTLKTLDKIRDDDISRDQAAEVLGTQVRQVNYLMNSWGVKRPLKDYPVVRTASKVKWELRKKCAIDYIAGDSEIEVAAERAGCSTRQMRRWVSELLKKHFEMEFIDLRRLTDTRKRRIADEIETAEGLELAKQQVLNAISRGEKSVREEALERVLAKRKNRGVHVR